VLLDGGGERFFVPLPDALLPDLVDLLGLSVRHRRRESVRGEQFAVIPGAIALLLRLRLCESVLLRLVALVDHSTASKIEVR